VGYGDLSPGSEGSRLFTGIYMLIGLGIIFNIIGEAFDMMMGWMEGKCVALGRMMGVGWRAEQQDAPPPAWLFYTQNLAFYLLFGILLLLVISPIVFGQLQADLVFKVALWHCWVTATTVGYGDVSLVTQEARLWCSFHIVVSVSWLAGLVSHVQAKREELTFWRQRHRMISKQLDPSLIEELDQLGDGQLSRIEFVCGMLIGMGATLAGSPLSFEEHVAPLLARFAAIDEDNNGTLDHADLEFLFQQAQETEAAAQAAAQAEDALQSVTFKHAVNFGAIKVSPS